MNAELVATTERFLIFKHVVLLGDPESHIPREVYEAWFRPEVADVTRSVCQMTICPAINGFPLFVEWLHTCPDYRRQGIARELLKAVDGLLGDITLTPVTPEGEAFCDAVCTN